MSNNTPNGRIKAKISSILRRTDTFILHLHRLLSTTSGLEATLATALFSLSLVHAQLSHLLIRQKERQALENAFKAWHSPRPAATIVATITAGPKTNSLRTESRLEKTSKGILNLARASDEILMFLRLFGLLQIYNWAHSRYKHPPRDPWIKLLVWAQILSSATFQTIENTAYLARKGILRGATIRSRTARLIALGNKFWMTQHVLEILRLLRVRQLRWNEDFGAEEEKREIGVESEELKKQWQRDVVFNVSWLPIRLHAAHVDEDESSVTDTWFGVFGLVPSLIMLQDAWRRSSSSSA